MRADEDPNSPEAGERFLAENGKRPDVVTRSSGLQYRIITRGDGLVRPGLDTKCSCHYVGTLLDGTQFDSSYEKGRPSTFQPDQVIKGWTEAMTTMVRARVSEAPCPVVYKSENYLTKRNLSNLIRDPIEICPSRPSSPAPPRPPSRRARRSPATSSSCSCRTFSAFIEHSPRRIPLSSTGMIWRMASAACRAASRRLRP